MHHFPYPSYLRTHRKQWALTQPELGALLGTSANMVSKYEKLARTPGAHIIIGSEFVFGEPARRIFPHLYSSVELEVTKRAVAFAERIAARKDKEAHAQRALLEAIAERAASDRPYL